MGILNELHKEKITRISDKIFNESMDAFSKKSAKLLKEAHDKSIYEELMNEFRKKGFLSEATGEDLVKIGNLYGVDISLIKLIEVIK